MRSTCSRLSAALVLTVVGYVNADPAGRITYMSGGLDQWHLTDIYSMQADGTDRSN